MTAQQSALARLMRMIQMAGDKITNHNRYATYEDGRFQVYITPVEQRTRAMKEHFRVGYYMLVDGLWRRTNKDKFLAEMAMEAGL